jgi:hypothetical protein
MGGVVLTLDRVIVRVTGVLKGTLTVTLMSDSITVYADTLTDSAGIFTFAADISPAVTETKADRCHLAVRADPAAQGLHLRI